MFRFHIHIKATGLSVEIVLVLNFVSKHRSDVTKFVQIYYLLSLINVWQAERERPGKWM